jgi:methylmalonyl-CoA/ethylmalonyl-CoA epimerase
METAASLLEPPQTAAGETLHHLGFAVPEIRGSVDRFIAGFRLRWDGIIIHDPGQSARVTFLSHQAPGLPLIELVEPDSPESHLTGFLKRGGGLHHVCYEVDSVQKQLDHALATGAILLSPPTPAVAFNGREIAWVCTRDRVFVEYLDRIGGAL